MDRTKLEARSAAFAAAAFEFTGTIRHRPGGGRPAEQLLDCATSIGANYRATARARSRDEFIAKLGVVVEEADESVYWLEFMVNTRLGDPPAVDTLLREARELRAIFAASYRTARRNHRAQKLTRQIPR